MQQGTAVTLHEGALVSSSAQQWSMQRDVLGLPEHSTEGAVVLGANLCHNLVHAPAIQLTV
jgi:hypothetical protein